MGENSAIAWTDHTYNPWRGCSKVGPGCDGCYAEARDQRYEGGLHWGPGAPRIRAVEATLNGPLQLQRKIEAGKIAPDKNKVFTLSLGDAFDNEIDESWRDDLWQKVRETQKLRYLIVTKRIGNVMKMIPPDWEKNFRHCGIIATVVTQDEIDRDGPKMKDIRKITTWTGLSIEPQLESIGLGETGDYIDWAIVGGESRQPNHIARPFDLEWPRTMIFQCKARKIACFIKQLGDKPLDKGDPHPLEKNDGANANPAHWPQDLRVRQFPAALQ